MVGIRIFSNHLRLLNLASHALRFNQLLVDFTTGLCYMSLTFKSDSLVQYFRTSLNTITPPGVATFPVTFVASSHPFCLLPLWNDHGGPLLLLTAKFMLDKATSEPRRLIN